MKILERLIHEKKISAEKTEAFKEGESNLALQSKEERASGTCEGSRPRD